MPLKEFYIGEERIPIDDEDESWALVWRGATVGGRCRSDSGSVARFLGGH